MDTSADSTEHADTFGFRPSLTQLRAFYEVAELASISGAADRLRRSQSAITQSIQKIEAELDVALFDRAASGSYLTQAGVILQQRASNFFRLLEAGLARILREAEAGPSAPDRVQAMVRRVTRAQMLALTCVHEYGSFAVAARHVPVSLTSLNRSARSLEADIGVNLMRHTANGVTTNAAGAALSTHFQLAMRELEAAAEEIRSLQGRLKGRIIVGSLLLAGNPYVALRLNAFVDRHPLSQVRLVHGSYDELLGRLRGGTIDFLVGALKNPQRIDDILEEPLAADPYVVVARRSHPLMQKGRLTDDDLRQVEWMGPLPSSVRRSVFETMFRGGALPQSTIETHSLLTVIVILSSSDRVALLTRSELALDRRLDGKLAALDYPVAARPAEIGVTTRRAWQPTVLQQAFLASLREATEV